MINMKNLFETLKIKKLSNGGPISPDDINDLFPDDGGFQFSPYQGESSTLNELLFDLFGVNTPQALKYLQAYDTTSEELAGLQRQQSEFEAGQQLATGISSAQNQIGSSLANMYAQGRSGQSGFGGTTLPDVIRRNLMVGYGDVRSGLQQDYQGAMTDSVLTEATAIQSARDAYESDIMSMLSTLQSIIDYNAPDTYDAFDQIDFGPLTPSQNTDCPEGQSYNHTTEQCEMTTGIGDDYGLNIGDEDELDVGEECVTPGYIWNGTSCVADTGISDIRAKKNVVKVGKSKLGLNIYEFDYINKKYGEGRYRGVMAQEVPHAAILDNSGYYMVDYNKVDVNFERIA